MKFNNMHLTVHASFHYDNYVVDVIYYSGVIVDKIDSDIRKLTRNYQPFALIIVIGSRL